MRYFTKEWYIDSLIAEMCFQLRKTEKASVYSDRFFEKLYAIEQKAYIKFQKRYSKISRTAFDERTAIAEFEANFKDNLEFVKSNLPNDILADIADIRVLALGSATTDNAMKITRFCGKKNRLCESVERKYNDASEEADEKLGGATKLLFELTGAPVASLESDNEHNITLTTSHEATGTAIKLTFTNAFITECDEEIVGKSILKYELLTREGGKYEFSILTLGEKLRLYVATIESDSIEVIEI